MFAVFRCAKLYRGNGSASFSRAMRHLREHSRSAEISRPELSQYNMQKIMPQSKVQSMLSDWIAEHNENNKRAHRKDAAVAVELIFSYSSDRPKEENTRGFYGNQSKRFSEQFEADIDAFMRENFPHLQKVAIARHMDEESFHWHIIGIPYDKEKKRLSAKDQLGGPKEMRDLQTKFADKVKHLGIKRGISKDITNSTHKTKQEHNRQKLAQENASKKKVIREAHKALEDVFSDR